MIIAVDDSMPYYALKWALNSVDDEEVNYICNRLIEAVPQMQKALTLQLRQKIADYFASTAADYLKQSPIKRLLEMLNIHLKEFRE